MGVLTPDRTRPKHPRYPNCGYHSPCPGRSLLACTAGGQACDKRLSKKPCLFTAKYSLYSQLNFGPGLVRCMSRTLCLKDSMSWADGPKGPRSQAHLRNHGHPAIRRPNPFPNTEPRGLIHLHTSMSKKNCMSLGPSKLHGSWFRLSSVLAGAGVGPRRPPPRSNGPTNAVLVSLAGSTDRIRNCPCTHSLVAIIS